MLTAVLFVAVLAADGTNPEPLVVMGQIGKPDAPPPPAKAVAFDQLWAGMTLKEVVDLIGPGYVPALSGTGNLRWTCADGRTLTVSHTTDPAAVLTRGGKGTLRKPIVDLRDTDGISVPLPAKP